jgi:hypothetical protein
VMRPRFSQYRFEVVHSLGFSFCAQRLTELFIAEMNSLIVEYAVTVANILHNPLEFSRFKESFHVFCIVSESLVL